MAEIQKEKKTCTVKVVINPSTNPATTIRYDFTNLVITKAHVKIICPNVESLHTMVERLRSELKHTRFNYRISFNWKNTPDAVKTDQKFKEKIYQIFGFNGIPIPTIPPGSRDSESHVVESLPPVPPNTPIDAPNELILEEKIEDSDLREHYRSVILWVKEHVSTHGASPDFSKRTPKGVKKIVNYIRTVSGQPHMTIADALFIAEHI
jgi:hypothetical protein